MSKGTLDGFFGSKPPPPKPIIVKCAKCGQPLDPKKPRYDLDLKNTGKKEPCCQPCAKKILRPQENAENL